MPPLPIPLLAPSPSPSIYLSPPLVSLSAPFLPRPPPLQTIIFVCILYPMIFFERTAIHFFFYLCMTLLSLMFYVAFGMGLSYISPSQSMAQVGRSGGGQSGGEGRKETAY